MTINLMWPREAFYGVEWYQKWGPVSIVAVLLAAGLIWWYAVQQHKGETLAEHRPTPPPDPMSPIGP
jgi:hypothetical protein